MISAMEKKQADAGNKGKIGEFRAKVEDELNNICLDILQLLDEKLLPAASAPTAASRRAQERVAIASSPASSSPTSSSPLVVTIFDPPEGHRRERGAPGPPRVQRHVPTCLGSACRGAIVTVACAVPAFPPQNASEYGP